MGVGKNIKIIREGKGFTRTDVGERMGVTRQAIFYIEKRDRHRVETLKRLAGILDCNIVDFFTE